jgi:hypothetical protein
MQRLAQSPGNAAPRSVGFPAGGGASAKPPQAGPRLRAPRRAYPTNAV